MSTVIICWEIDDMKGNVRPEFTRATVGTPGFDEFVWLFGTEQIIPDDGRECINDNFKGSMK